MMTDCDLPFQMLDESAIVTAKLEHDPYDGVGA
jgi:hypothetical protein